jgi:hypothetical protein
MNFGIAKMAEWGGKYWDTILKTNNNQLHGSHSLWECMAWDGRNHQGMEEHVRSSTLNFCNKNGGTSGVARGP